ncbi:MAG: hypothetical protein NTV80_05870 [Verrucomicrobia bacterium]|nr:hypothetical protein [Verrucomicrobiota bacterium]
MNEEGRKAGNEKRHKPWLNPSCIPAFLIKFQKPDFGLGKQEDRNGISESVLPAFLPSLLNSRSLILDEESRKRGKDRSPALAFLALLQVASFSQKGAFQSFRRDYRHG